MKNSFLLGFLSFTVLLKASGFSQSGLKSEVAVILEDFRIAINTNNYDRIKDHLDPEFVVEGYDHDPSWTTFYSYLNFNDAEEIKGIRVDKLLDGGSIVLVKGTIQFKNYPGQVFTVRFKKEKDKLKIIRISNFKPDTLPLVVRASYVNEQIFGDDRPNNIKNLKILDTSAVDSLESETYTIYFDSPNLDHSAKYGLQLFDSLDRFLLEIGFEEIERENLLLTAINSSNTSVIGLSRLVPWSMALYEKAEVNNEKLKNKIITTFSHEIVEGTLLNKYNLREYKFRWFRDGLSDYVAFKFSERVDQKIANEYFLEGRLNEAEKFKQAGHLLDWRGNGPIAEVDKGKLYGDRFIYFNNEGQYGRAFKFFYDNFENNEFKLGKLLEQIKTHQLLDVSELINIMSHILEKDVELLISEY